MPTAIAGNFSLSMTKKCAMHHKLKVETGMRRNGAGLGNEDYR